VAKAAPDGYTLLWVNAGFATNASLYKKLNHDPVKDFMPITQLTSQSYVFVAHPSVPVKNVREFAALSNARKGGLVYASTGAGSLPHLGMELLRIKAGVPATHIPYKGAGPALADLIGGQVHVLFDNLPSSIGHIKGGKIRALAVTSAQPEPSLPGIPTVGETVPGYEATAWFGVGMPKGTPREIIEKVNAEVNRALADPKMRERLAELGGAPIPGTPEDFGKVIAAETEKWAKVVAASGATVD